MKPTKDNARTMIKTYEWSIAVWSDIALYGPPTQHVFLSQMYASETREETLRADLDRLAYWQGVYDSFC